MKKFKLASFFAALAVALFVTTTSANAKTASPSLSVNPVVNHSKTITGKATKGVGIVVRNSKKQTIAKSSASKTTGKYTVKLKSEVKTNQKYYVYARRSSVSYFYRIVTVQAKKSSTTTTNTTNKTNNSSSKGSNVTIATPTGTWKSNSHKGYSVVYSFSQSKGFNVDRYKNGKFNKHIVRYASYDVNAKSPKFWQITYHAKNSSKVNKFYVHFSSNKRFYLVNSSNKVAKQSIAGLPANTYHFDLK